MPKLTVSALVLAAFVMPSAAAAQPPAPTGKTFTLAAELLRGYRMVQQNLAEAAEKMPDDQYSFTPTPEIRPFGQLVAHVSLSQFNMCARLRGEPNPKKDEKEGATRTKADQIALLKASTAYCDPVITTLTDATMTELIKSDENQVAKGLFPMSIVAHGDEMYGTMAVYLRLKGIVPPSTERMNEQMKKNDSMKKPSQ
jgi:uncharacterized damage-inducible protein DinB